MQPAKRNEKLRALTRATQNHRPRTEPSRRRRRRTLHTPSGRRSAMTTTPTPIRALAASAAVLLLFGTNIDPVAAEIAPVMCHGQRATIVGTAGNDLMSGTRHRDVISALG